MKRIGSQIYKYSTNTLPIAIMEYFVHLDFLCIWIVCYRNWRTRPHFCMCIRQSGWSGSCFPIFQWATSDGSNLWAVAWVCHCFNPVPKKLMCFNYVSSEKPYITHCGKPVDVIDNDLHLGNRIYNNVYSHFLYMFKVYVKAVLECPIVLLKSICMPLFVTVFFMELNYITSIRPL